MVFFTFIYIYVYKLEDTNILNLLETIYQCIIIFATLELSAKLNIISFLDIVCSQKGFTYLLESYPVLLARRQKSIIIWLWSFFGQTTTEAMKCAGTC